MASGAMVLVKYLLFIFNFIFWVSGICLIAVGVIVKLKFGDFIQVSDSRLTTAPVFIIIIGVVVAVVGFLGCCGAYKENYCMVTTFAVFLGLIFILEIAAGAYAYAHRDEIKEVAENGLRDALEKYSNEDVRKALDKTQEEFHCCGASGFKDYLDSVHISNGTGFPPSCCKNQTVCPKTFGEARNTTIYNTSTNSTVFVSKGCVDGFEAYLLDHLKVVGGVGIGVAFIQLIGIIFACCLMRSIKKEYEVM